MSSRWFKFKDTKWIHQEKDKVIIICSVIESTGENDLVVIEDRQVDSEIIGYYDSLMLLQIMKLEEIYQRLKIYPVI